MPTIKRRSDFLEAFRHGKKYAGTRFILYVLDGEGRKQETGFSIGRFAGKAHDRNRVRRRVREIYRLSRQHIKPCRQVVVFKPSSTRSTYLECEQELRLLWSRAGIWI